MPRYSTSRPVGSTSMPERVILPWWVPRPVHGPTLVLEQLQHRQGAAKRRSEVHPRGPVPDGGEQLPRVRHPDLGRIWAGIPKRRLELLGDDNPRELVVEAQREPVGGNGKETDQQWNRRLAAEPLEQPVEVFQVEDELRHGELRAVLDLACEPLQLEVEVVCRRVDGTADEERGRCVDRSPVV